MRSSNSMDAKVEEMKPSKSDINWVVMDYLIAEGYPGAAEKFAQETNLHPPSDMEGMRDRVRIRTAIHDGRIDEAVALINDFDPKILDANPLLHFHLLQLQLIEIIRATLDRSSANSSTQPIAATDFLPAVQFATEQLAPRAPTDPAYQNALERTMALMIFPPEKMAPEFRELLDPCLRERVAADVNAALLGGGAAPAAPGHHRAEARIRQLVRARAWAEARARDAKVDLPSPLSIGLDAPSDEGVGNGQADTMLS